MFDVILILSGGIDQNGKLPSRVINRLQEGLKLHTKHPSTPILLSGKYVHSCKNPPPITEAKAMKNYLLKQGCKANLILEEKAQDTIGNAYFSKPVLIQNNWDNLAIITSDFHIPRAKYTFEKILGPSYKLTFFKAKAEIDPNEEVVFTLIKNWLDSITHTQIEGFIQTKHPVYKNMANIKRTKA